MGGGSWTESSYERYSKSKGRTYDFMSKKVSTQGMFERRRIHESLDPFKVVRECCDSAEHPNTIPVILALDVTGSMGKACYETASSLGAIMNDLYKKYTDIEFMMMAIGDLAYDDAPIQASQFESDERIAEAIDNIYMEMGGGGNAFESYSAAWYFGLHHTKLDCWNRGKKGIIITLGDEPMNPYLPKRELSIVLGDSLQADVNTPELYNEAKSKFDIYHIAVDDANSSYNHYRERIDGTWGKLLQQNLRVSTIKSLSKVITGCIDDSLQTTNGGSWVVQPEQAVATPQESQPVEAGVITW